VPDLVPDPPPRDEAPVLRRGRDQEDRHGTRGGAAREGRGDHPERLAEVRVQELDRRDAPLERQGRRVRPPPAVGLPVRRAVEEGVLPRRAQDFPGQERPRDPPPVAPHPRQEVRAGGAPAARARRRLRGLLGEDPADVVRVAAEAVPLRPGEGGAPHGRGRDVVVRRADPLGRRRASLPERGLEHAPGEPLGVAERAQDLVGVPPPPPLLDDLDAVLPARPAVEPRGLYPLGSEPGQAEAPNRAEPAASSAAGPERLPDHVDDEEAAEARAAVLHSVGSVRPVLPSGGLRRGPGARAPPRPGHVGQVGEGRVRDGRVKEGPAQGDEEGLLGDVAGGAHPSQVCRRERELGPLNRGGP